MNCFECNSKCVTNYYICPNRKKITHVNKMCNACGWESHKTKVPEPID